MTPQGLGNASWGLSQLGWTPASGPRSVHWVQQWCSAVDSGQVQGQALASCICAAASWCQQLPHPTPNTPHSQQPVPPSSHFSTQLATAHSQPPQSPERAGRHTRAGGQGQHTSSAPHSGATQRSAAQLLVAWLDRACTRLAAGANASGGIVFMPSNGTQHLLDAPNGHPGMSYFHCVHDCCCT